MGTSWLINPLSNPLLVPLAVLLLALFGGVAFALFILQSARTSLSHDGTIGQRNPLTPQMVLWQRYRTWALIAFLFAGALISGPLAIAVLCAFLSWQGGREYAILTGMPGLQRTMLIIGGWMTCIAVLLFGSTVLTIAPVLAFFGWSLLILQPVEPGAEISRRFTVGLSGLWGYLYIGWLPAYLLALSIGKMPGLVLVVGLGVALSDVGAFCVGKTLGRIRIAPHLSPNKTLGGILGNILGAALAVLLTSFALPGIDLWQWCLLILVIGLGSVWGDLLESLLKRQHGVKDAGELLPGFGGLLDRIDSLLLVAPLVYYLSLLLFNS
jgi:phosphatidate cytidylyltransferase